MNVELSDLKAELSDLKNNSTHPHPWNENIIEWINSIGFFHLDKNIYLLEYLSSCLLIIVTLILLKDFYLKSKRYLKKNKIIIVESINSFFHFYTKKCLYNSEFRFLIFKLSGFVLGLFSVIGFLLGSTMFGFIFGLVLELILLYDLYDSKLHITE